ncbi:fasciclin domain-containing protein [Pontixanthobacter luteolus]|uniref:fasciclin domain-containing protein n=1 Tax=Pontixanthobacter luteolus TaxID=295089 RepID=UPI002303094A|nr:fasciclin domain-containing protein [Pontixanthobacter luteolus]
MRTPSKFRAAAFAAVAAMGTFAAISTAPVSAHNHKMAEKSQPNIVQTAMSTGVHNTLVAAVKAAGLVDTLASPGPFTVFAPTDDAFSKLPDGTVDSLLKPENKGTLTKVLTYHAVAGSVTAADLLSMIDENGGAVTISTVAGDPLVASKFGDTVAITDAAGRTTVVSTADVKTSNGVIHVTDGVFLPG